MAQQYQRILLIGILRCHFLFSDRMSEEAVGPYLIGKYNGNKNNCDYEHYLESKRA